MDTLQKYFKEKRDDHLTELKKLLRIPSISALSIHKNDMIQNANWMAACLKNAGLYNVSVMPTQGHPVVYGEWTNAPNKPTVLIYGHYDVQPVDPLELWDSPPFEPTIREEKVFARGATDDKGQVFMHIKAIQAMLEVNGTLPVNVKVCIEGEEELGSPHLDAFVEENKDLLSADVLVVSDTPMLEKGKPAICYGLRGLCGLQIDIEGPKADLHSGLYGGAVHNPIHALTTLLSTMHDEKGRIAIDNFYDKVVTPTDEERKAFEKLANNQQLLTETGVSELYGEKGFTPLERIWARPTLEINGIYGGFQGEGIKTAIPSTAHAKITCRLIEEQDPDEILHLIDMHIEKHKPKGVKVTTTHFDKGKPFKTPYDHPAIQASAKAYQACYGVAPVYIRMGGSIPIVETFGHTLQLPVVLMGFGLPTENFHAPNEHFHLENFDKGLLTICEFFNQLATVDLQ